MTADEALEGFVHERAFDADAGDGVGTVEDVERQFGGGGGFQGVLHGAVVGIEARADVLDVENKGVELREHGGAGTAIGFAVEAEDADAGLRFAGVGDLFVVLFAEHAVFGGEEGGDVYAHFAHDDEAGAAIESQAGVVGDYPDSFALQAGELFGD